MMGSQILWFRVHLRTRLIVNGWLMSVGFFCFCLPVTLSAFSSRREVFSEDMFSGSGHTQEEDELPFEFKALELALEISTSALDLQVRTSSRRGLQSSSVMSCQCDDLLNLRASFVKCCDKTTSPASSSPGRPTPCQRSLPSTPVVCLPLTCHTLCAVASPLCMHGMPCRTTTGSAASQGGLYGGNVSSSQEAHIPR